MLEIIRSKLRKLKIPYPNHKPELFFSRLNIKKNNDTSRISRHLQNGRHPLIFNNKMVLEINRVLHTQSIQPHWYCAAVQPTYPSLTGLYLFESGYEKDPSPEDGKVKYGVQISDLSKILEDIKVVKMANILQKATL